MHWCSYPYQNPPGSRLEGAERIPKAKAAEDKKLATTACKADNQAKKQDQLILAAETKTTKAAAKAKVAVAAVTDTERDNSMRDNNDTQQLNRLRGGEGRKRL